MSNPILFVFFPVFYVFGALFSLVQLQVFLTLIGQGVSKAKTIALLEPLVPVLSNFNDFIVKVFGPAHKFVPQPTHVFLVALILAIVVHTSKR